MANKSEAKQLITLVVVSTVIIGGAALLMRIFGMKESPDES